MGMQYCQPDGTCAAPVVSKEQCAGARDACADKECGAVCASSDGMTQVMQYCQPDGTCAAPVVSKEQCARTSGISAYSSSVGCAIWTRDGGCNTCEVDPGTHAILGCTEMACVPAKEPQFVGCMKCAKGYILGKDRQCSLSQDGAETTVSTGTSDLCADKKCGAV